MMKPLILPICLALICLQPAIARCASPLEQLSANNIDAVEHMFSDLQGRFEKGRASEYELLDAYKAFYQREDRYRPQLNNWIQRYPQSASAYLARGVYYLKLGWFRRGTGYISQVPRENLEYLEQMLVLAKNDLEMSLRLNPSSYLTILHLLNIAQDDGDDRTARKYLALGNAVLPSNFLVRARYLIHLTPKWGGSYGRMDQFITECQAQGVPQDKIALLRAIKLDDQGTAAEERGNVLEARAAFQEALVLSRPAGARFRQDYLWSSSRLCAEPAYRSKEYCR